MQAHVKLPGVLVQVAFVLHPPLLVRHSSTSAQVCPSPEYPELQAQELLPGRFVQVASGAQPPLPVRHSFWSTQLTPSPE